MIDGIDKYPNLKKQLEHELSANRGCAACTRNKIIAKYTQLVKHKNAQARHQTQKNEKGTKRG